MRGIYAITNILTDTVYYGQSGNIRQRIYSHQSTLKRNIHKNPHLQASWNKYGEKAFVFAPIQLIEDVTIDLTSIEKKYKDNAYSLGLKLLNIKEPDPTAPLSEETKKKISIYQKGRKHSTEQNKKQALFMKNNKHALGCKHTEEMNRKNSERGKGKTPPSPKGRILSNETKRKISISRKQYFLNKKLGI